jgi:hypothetical protein
MPSFSGMNQNQPWSNQKMMMLPSSLPQSRTAFAKWPNMAELLCAGLRRLIFILLAMKVSRPRGVHDEFRPPLVRRAIAVGGRDARGIVLVAKLHFANAAVLARFHHHAPGAPEEDLVEFRAAHLVGHRDRRVGALGELETRDVVVPGRDEGGAPFLHADGAHLLAHAELLEERHVGRQERFADVEPRVRFLLQQDHLVAALGEQRGGGGTGGTPADHDDVAVFHGGNYNH